MGKLSTEAVERFRELHPERFAELQAQAERDWDKPTIRHTISYTPTTTLHPDRLPDWFKRGLIPEQALEEFRAGRKQYWVQTTEHLYFELAYTPLEAIEVARSRHPGFSGTVVDVKEECPS